MEVPLTPLEFARRARKLYSEREAVVDGELRLTYGQFFDRCDRWSSALQNARGATGRSCGLHRTEHACPTGVFLRCSPDRSGFGAHQLSPDCR